MTARLPVWALVDARAVSDDEMVSASTRVAGLSLLARHVRTAARLGWAGTQVLVETDAERSEVEAALARDRPPAGHAIDVVGPSLAPPTGQVVSLALRAIYAQDDLARAATNGEDPRPLVEVDDPAGIPAIEQRLMGRIRKSIAHDGVVAYFLMRPLSRAITRAIVDTKITPNQVTMVALVFGVAGGLLAFGGGFERTAVGALLVWVGAVIDCVDGEIARLRLEGSRLGQWLDTLADDLTTFALVAGLGVGLCRDGAGEGWAWLGIGAAVLWAVTEAKSYVDLHRWGLPIDTAQYPWFFGVPAQGLSADAGWVARAVYIVGFVFKRDAFITLLALLLLLDFRRVATLLLAGGCVVMFVLLVVHKVVMAVRGRG
jgi:phosphatidylglycerophosphate synthase